ncbi:CHAP domain-containing protein, partial [Candidatus Microgenomates bacterium CPR3]|nr:CHAP domain-containing protein [Candidatus Microgenomates bacterium CPR3]
SGAGQFIGSLLCDSGEGGGKNNSRIQTAACIVEILSKCGINPLTSSNANGNSWQCVLASTLAQSAIAVLKESATNYTYLQCVGFVRAIDVANGGAGSGFGDAKTLLASPPTGYKPVLGIGSCSPGDFFVDTTTGGYGHVGVFIDNGGATIRCADANGGGNGVVRGPDGCTWLSSRVAGCLKKI